jgi:hypothetical protein
VYLPMKPCITIVLGLPIGDRPHNNTHVAVVYVSASLVLKAFYFN